MLRTVSLTGALVGLCLLGSACTVEGQVRTTGYVSTPDLVLVEPGVYVVADYSYPVFYNDGYYWRYRDGYWLRSYTYSGGWARVRHVPYGVRRIHQPQRYVHYRPHARAHVYRQPVRRGAAPQRVHVRDHRSDRRYYERRDSPRYDRRDNRRDVRDHRRDVREHRRDDRRRDARDHRERRRDDRRDDRRRRDDRDRDRD